MLLLLSLACTGDATVELGHDTSSSDSADTAPADSLSWPGEDWATGTPEEHGLDAAALDALQDYVFSDANYSQALAVFKDGVLVYEHYADDAEVETPVTSWSAAKSVTSALIGVAIREGHIELDDPVSEVITEWAEGPNAAITIRDMLEMQSGLPENTSNAYGVYGAEPDQLAYALERELVREPGTRYSYVNEDSMVLSAVVSRVFGEQAHEIAAQEIFAPIGMSADWWVDGEGQTLGYCCLDTTARDFARFGLLYARGGAWEGQQIIPADYLAESTSGQSLPAPTSGQLLYGLHWWMDGDDAFAAIGLDGQYVWVWPDQDLVVVRFGEYNKIGQGTVREGNNYQSTREPGALDGGELSALIRATVTD